MALTLKHPTLAEGKTRTLDLMSKYGIDPEDIITSKDDNMVELQKELAISEEFVPEGFITWQLPFFFEEGCLSYFSCGAPNAYVLEHSHDEGQQLRIIMTGFILYGKKALAQGDWLHVPAGKPYSFSVGPQGASMFYCRQSYCWA